MGGDQEVEFDEAGRILFEALRAFRIETAREAKVPPYVVASDRTLRDIVALRPATMEELQLVHGIGPSKSDKYGDAILRVVRSSRASEMGETEPGKDEES